ncbi:MAG: TlpA family protein disulfide reductase [Magnetococcales bacterium]|nr:TlpA family protein disulfide reductase [Magnetococcales bacterium]
MRPLRAAARTLHAQIKPSTTAHCTLSLALVGMLLILPHTAQAIEGQTAPEWQISEWLNGPGIELGQLKGQVVIIEFFQLWCPGCKRFSIPLMKAWHKRYAKRIRQKKMYLLSIHSVFEGHEAQSPARLRAFVLEEKIKHLVGIDRHPPDREIPMTMRLYRTRGTPEMVVIDKQGVVRFQRFGGFDPDLIEKLVEKLLVEPDPS